MQYTDDRYRLRVEIQAKGCSVPEDERARLQRSLEPLGEAVRGFPESELRLTFLYHPGSDYHVEARLRLPGQTLFSTDWDPYLDSALQRCLRKLQRKAEDYRDNPDRRAAARAQRRSALDRDVVAPTEPDAGPLGRAVSAGDYRAFRDALAGYEDWLRLRAGRWLQRYPEAEARVGGDLLIGDLVEEIYLNAFERYGQRSRDVSFRDWLEGLLDPSLKGFLRHPDEASENARMARSLRGAPAGRQ